MILCNLQSSADGIIGLTKFPLLNFVQGDSYDHNISRVFDECLKRKAVEPYNVKRENTKWSNYTGYI